MMYMAMNKLTTLFVATIVILLSIVLINRPGDRSPASSPDFEDLPDSTQDSSQPEDVIVKSGTFSASIQHDNLTRSYLLHIPLGYKSSDQYPVVFFLHGGGGSAERLLPEVGLTEKADAEGFIVIAPNSVDGNWNDGRGTTAWENTADTVSAIDDVGFIEVLLAEVENLYAVDTSRVYVTGFSNGAQMTQRLGCELPNTFAAIAPVAGPMRGNIIDLCKNANPIPVIGIQGTEDPFFPIEDADGIPEMPRVLAQRAEQTPMTVATITEYWSAKNGCTQPPQSTVWADTARDGTVVTQYDFTNCTSGKDVRYYIIDGSGHSWPPTGEERAALQNLTGGTSNNIVANDVIWEFFSQHSL